MPHPISTLGAAHTLISLVPAAVGIYSFARYRGIDAATRSGRIYLGGLLLAVLTSFGLSSSGGFNAGHALGILALLSAGEPCSSRGGLRCPGRNPICPSSGSRSVSS